MRVAHKPFYFPAAHCIAGREKKLNYQKMHFSFYFRSMAKALPMVKEMIVKLVESRSKIPTWVLTTFNDPNVTLVKKTNEVQDLISGLGQLKYGGGGDPVEEAFQGEISGI